jgi:hypothetical protein
MANYEGPRPSASGWRYFLTNPNVIRSDSPIAAAIRAQAIPCEARDLILLF